MLRCFIAVLPLLLAACTGLLPRVQSESSPFNTFEEARIAIDALVPMKSTVQTLTQLGIEPVKQANTVILTHADVVRRFLPSNLLRREDLDPGVLACVEARDACRGWEISAERVLQARTGGFFSDFTNFSRRTETSGWRFNAIILLVNDTVVYRAWGGTPRLKAVEVKTNPLGPLQDIGPAILTTH
ncbi:MAG TPA: hypothetical protein VIM63_04870 [Rhodoferax sp.]